MPGAIRVLHVDDDPEIADLTATMLTSQSDRMRVETAPDARAGLERLDDDIDCIVSDYDMPGPNGIEFLEDVRESHPDLPFLLYTGKGSEAVASEAISAGVTDYIQKDAGSDHFALLANRIENAVDAQESAAAARRQKRRLERILGTVPSCVVQLDAGGQVVFANDRTEAVLGLRPAEIVDRAYDELDWRFLGDDGEPLPETAVPFRRVRDTGEPVYGERHAVEQPDGTVKTLLVNSAPLTDADGTVESIVCSLTDVTDHERREQSLRETKRKLDLALEGTDTGVWEWNVETDEVHWNETLERTMEMEPGSFEGTFEAFADRVHPADMERVQAKVESVLETGGQYEAEFRMFAADGSVQWVETRGRLVEDEAGNRRLVGIHTDVTERKEYERELEATKGRYEALVENFPEGGVFLFDEDCTYTLAGGAELSRYDLSPADFEGAQPADLFPEDIAAELREYYQRAFDGETNTFEQSFHDTRYRVRTCPVRDDAGEIIAGMAVSQNVTERHEREATLERQNERLERFTSIVSHDLRNPLTMANARLELAQDECDSPHLDHVARGHDQMAALIEDLLTLAREGEAVTEVEPVDIDDVATLAWRNVDTAGATLSLDADGQLRADRDRLRQILENLMRNAVEHGSTSPASDGRQDAVEHGSTSPDSPTRRDAVEHGSASDERRNDADAADPDERTDADTVVHVGCLDGQRGFYVADDGPGIPEDEREDVFDAGYSTSDEGTGFGLSIVAELADAHGWQVSVTESQWGGARFEISGIEPADIPAADDADDAEPV